MIVKVRCSFEIDVEFNESDRDRIGFIVEENGCPGTGKVGAAIEKRIESQEKQNYCWACGLNSENKILSIDGVPYDDE